MQGRVALVTGASTGIGRAIATAFARKGAKVVMAARTADTLEVAAAGIGGDVLAVPCDVTREDAVTGLFAQAEARFGPVDVLVNNAGITTRTATADLTLAEWQRVVDTNITAAFLCSRAAFRSMKGRGGRIINIGSVSALVPRANSVPYTTSKFAIDGMTRAFGLDGREFGIAVSVIHPGNTRSELWADREGAAAQEGIMAAEDVARVAVLMATLPKGVNLLESVILPVTMPLLGRG